MFPCYELQTPSHTFEIINANTNLTQWPNITQNHPKFSNKFHLTLKHLLEMPVKLFLELSRKHK